MATTQENTRGIITLASENEYKTRSLTLMAVRRFLKHRMAVFGALLLLAIILFVTVGAQFYTEFQGNKTNVLFKETAPNSEYPFGTDQVGRNVLPRMVYGGQISLAIGAVAVTISIIVGTVVGMVSGYFGGWIDAILSRITEALLSIPVLILLLVLSSVLSRYNTTMTLLGRKISAMVVVIVLIIGLTSWMQLSRIVRSLVLSFKEQDFILAAKALGAHNRRILFIHILPNCLAPIIVSATLGIGTAIIIEAYLSFLGFGVQPPTATWGNILNAAQNNIETRWWLWMIPGSFIVATVLAINFIGDGLRDALDPRSIQ